MSKVQIAILLLVFLTHVTYEIPQDDTKVQFAPDKLRGNCEFCKTIIQVIKYGANSDIAKIPEYVLQAYCKVLTVPSVIRNCKHFIAENYDLIIITGHH